MALANYVDLQASVANWIHRTDLTAIIPDFITLAESRIARDLLLRRQMVEATLVCVAGVQTVALPSDWLYFENLTVSASPGRQLSYVPVEHIDAKYSSLSTGIPAVYSIEGGNIYLAPTPDSAYSLAVIYYARFPALSTASTNWLMTTHPNIYLFASLIEAAQYTMNNELLQIYATRYQTEMQALQDEDEAAQHSGSALRVKVI